MAFGPPGRPRLSRGINCPHSVDGFCRPDTTPSERRAYPPIGHPPEGSVLILRLIMLAGEILAARVDLEPVENRISDAHVCEHVAAQFDPVPGIVVTRPGVPYRHAGGELRGPPISRLRIGHLPRP